MGWQASKSKDGFWRPVLTAEGEAHELNSAWFTTKPECEEFIRQHLTEHLRSPMSSVTMS